MMFEHYKWKAWDDDAKIYVGSDLKIPFKIGCCLYYLDRSEPGGGINWAAGSTNGIADDAGVPQVSWTAYDNGINLILEYQEDLHFTSEGIVVVPLTETTPEETEAPTEPETEAPATEAPETEAPTAAPETEAPATDAPATDAPATEPAEGGCGSVIGFSAIAILAAAAAAIALKKD
jgi:septal ring-binding cell division protein DamX